MNYKNFSEYVNVEPWRWSPLFLMQEWPQFNRDAGLLMNYILRSGREQVIKGNKDEVSFISNVTLNLMPD